MLALLVQRAPSSYSSLGSKVTSLGTRAHRHTGRAPPARLLCTPSSHSACFLHQTSPHSWVTLPVCCLLLLQEQKCLGQQECTRKFHKQDEKWRRTGEEIRESREWGKDTGQEAVQVTVKMFPFIRSNSVGL